MDPDGGPVRRVRRGTETVALGAQVGRGLGLLGPVLAWAIVFADIGSSIYYVPGMLYRQIGPLAPAFVALAAVAFVLVALEHLEIAHRFPKGGGGVAAAVAAFGPQAGVISGALMVSAYLLTIVISVVTALHYVTLLRPFPHEIGIVSAVVLFGLGYLNWIGVRNLARVALFVALAALAVDLVLLVAVLSQSGIAIWAEAFAPRGGVRSLGWREVFAGFATAWLAYSGLESVGQLAPALKEPRRKVIRWLTVLLLASVVVTAPLFTALAVEAAGRQPTVPHAALLSPVALALGGRALQIAVTVTGAALLLLAANFAFVGCYNVFQAIGELGYLPAVVARRSPKTGTPRGAVVVITAGALALLAGSQAALPALAQLFAFGLLGSYAITSISLDVLRWREGKRGLIFWVGVLASLALVVPWIGSWVARWEATVYGALASAALLGVALVTRRGWIRADRFGHFRASSAEEAAAGLPGAGELLTLAEAVEVRGSYPGTTMVAIRSPNPTLCVEVAKRAKGLGDAAVYVISVDEIPGLFFPARTGPSPEARRALTQAVRELRKEGVDAVPIWRLAHDAGAAIAEAAEDLGVKCVMIGTTQRSTVWHFLRGDVFKQLLDELPDSIHVVICE